jgi:DNA-binding transcriptional ArsR family regulator
VTPARGAATSIGAEEVFAALADPTRWRVLNLLAAQGDGTATTLASVMPVTRVAVVKHLAVLDRAGLVKSRRRGREVRYVVRPERLEATARWLTTIASDWEMRLSMIKRIAESVTPDAGTSPTGRSSPRPPSRST